jgi:5-methylcytosine-specific restriction endonuclease McrA
MASSRTGTATWLRVAKQAKAQALERGLLRCPIKGCGVAMDWEYPGRPNSAEVDHIIPHSQGGKDVIENTRVKCRHCNQSLGGRLNRWRPRPIVQTVELQTSDIW